MSKWRAIGLLWLTVLVTALTSHNVWASDLLAPEKAFEFHLDDVSGDTVVVSYQIAPGYYMYRNQFKVSTESENVKLGALLLPQGHIKFDENFGEELETYRDKVTVRIPYQVNSQHAFELMLTSQGCADIGVCYPPQKNTIKVDPSTLRERAISASESSWWQRINSGNDYTIASELQGMGWWLVIAVFFLLGLLLSLTPCVLPMIPILSSIIVGQGQSVSRSKGLSLALWYVLGTAVIYTLFGVLAGLTGASLVSYLQHPVILIGFAILLGGLALAMFDVFQFQMPGFIQNRLSSTSQKVQGGQGLRVFSLGLLSALIAGPCVAAPLAGALVYISKTGNALLGGAALFSMAWGMGMPLLVVGVSAGHFLPKAGAWMEAVKRVFGVLLLAVAWWMVLPLMSVPAQLMGWAVLAIMLAAILGVSSSSLHAMSFGRLVRYTFAVLLMMLALVAILGSVTGAADPFRPLERFTAAGNVTDAMAEKAPALVFERVDSIAQLDGLLKQTDRPVMLDFYADWCVSCKEMERYTFSHQTVRDALKSVRLVQVDVTENTSEHQALLKRFDLFGPPGIIFFDAQGTENKAVRVVGFQDAEQFLKTLHSSLGLAN